MEQQLLTQFEALLTQSSDDHNNNKNNPSLLQQALTIANSLIINPSTTDSTVSSIFKTLTTTITTPSFQSPETNPLSLHFALSLLSHLSLRRPNFRPLLFSAALTLLPLPLPDTISTRAAADFLSLLLTLVDHDRSLIPSFADVAQSLFVSLCFRPCVSVRLWLLRNSDRFCVRPALLLTLLLGFSKDPYPLVREAALNGLIELRKCIVVEDYDLIQGCYFRAIELLFDSEDAIRCSAVRAVSEWGQILVAYNQERSKEEWSNALFVQLCSMVRDMNVEVRTEAFDALGKVKIVSEDILLQTLSKNALAIMKGKKYPGQLNAYHFEIPASNTAGAFLHGLEDEFHKVRSSACRSLRTLSSLSGKFSLEAVKLLMDVLNDDSTVVRLQALETMHRMALYDRLQVQETHMHMFLGTLVDASAIIRSATRKILHLAKLPNLIMFKLSFDGLVKNLEKYPQDEAEVFRSLFYIGRNHGNLAVGFVEEVAQQVEPSSEGDLGFDSARVAAMLVLAISAPLSNEQHTCSIPPRIFSYAVTLLGKISHCLAGIMDHNTLLDYLSYCSSSAVISASEFFKGKETVLSAITKGDFSGPLQICSQDMIDEASLTPDQKVGEEKKVGTSVLYHQQELHDELTRHIQLVVHQVKHVWPLIGYGCTAEVYRILRNWKKELLTITTFQSAGQLAFALRYLKVVKLLAKAWVHFMSPRKPCSFGRLILDELERNLREIRYRFMGLNKEEELHVLELLLVTFTMRFSSSESCFDRSALKKLYSTLSAIELILERGFAKPSDFIIELKNIFRDAGASTDGTSYDPFLFHQSLQCFSLRQFMLSGALTHLEAGIEVHGNNFENPLPFISGLPVGIPFEITLSNISSENRLWLRMTMDEKLIEFVFLDLDQYEGFREFRKFTFVGPFYGTPKVNCFVLRVCIGMECMSEDAHLVKGCRGPKHELALLCPEKEVYLSRAGIK